MPSHKYLLTNSDLGSVNEENKNYTEPSPNISRGCPAHSTILGNAIDNDIGIIQSAYIFVNLLQQSDMHAYGTVWE